MDSAPIVIEYFGLPGAGKTTVAENVISRLRRSGKRVADLSDIDQLGNRYSRERLLIGNQLLKAHIRYGMGLGYYLATTRPLKYESVIRTALLPLSELRLGRTLLKSEGCVYVLDQFTIQSIWSIAVGSNRWSKRWVSQVVHDMLTINNQAERAFVFFDIDADSAADRIESRTNGNSRFDNKARDEVLSKLRGEVSRMAYIAEEIQSSSRPMITIKGNEPIRNKVDAISDWIEDMCQNQC